MLHGIDATKLESYFKRDSYRSIVFQFPNVGSRDPKFGKNPNHHLIKRFLKSCKAVLYPTGQVIVSSVSSPHYDGAFNMPDAAKWARFKEPKVFPFFPSDYPNYQHTNTLDPTVSAINDAREFQTFVFRLDTR